MKAVEQGKEQVETPKGLWFGDCAIVTKGLSLCRGSWGTELRNEPTELLHSGCNAMPQVDARGWRKAEIEDAAVFPVRARYLPFHGHIFHGKEMGMGSSSFAREGGIVERPKTCSEMKDSPRF